MTRLLFVITAIIVAILVAALIPSLRKARARSGPTIAANLRTIQAAKEEWESQGGSNAWPTGKDIFDWTDERSLNEVFRSRDGEIYFINRTGAPPFAYIPKAEHPYRGGRYWF